MASDAPDLTPREYELFRRLVYEQAGINLGPNKAQLVRTRLAKRLRELGCESFSAYYKLVTNDTSGQELCRLLDAISTNTTYLFREMHHFEFLGKLLEKWLGDPKWRNRYPTLRIWSAACSSGEEAYSIAMVLHQRLEQERGVNFKILGTDISTRMLARARQGIYSLEQVKNVPPALRSRYLRTVEHNGKKAVQVVPELRQTITWARFNLMAPTYPFRNPFQIIFCRNVMIYFDRPTQESLVRKMHRHLIDGGYLLVGHSESLTNIDHPFEQVEPAIYLKTATPPARRRPGAVLTSVRGD